MSPIGFIVSLPRSRARALRWVCDFVFGENLARTLVILHDAEHIEISTAKKSLVFASLFPRLDEPREEWFRNAPSEPLNHFHGETAANFNLTRAIDSIPVLFGRPEIVQTSKGLSVKADLFGGIFYLLSRFEEIISDQRDLHDRFPGRASLAHREGFLTEPLADIYRHMIWTLISRVWPEVRIPEGPPPSIQVSCDVDEPFDRSVRNPFAFARTFAGDLVKRRSVTLAAKRAANYAFRRMFGPRFDPCHTFDWYMDQCEARGLRATFNFIAGNSAGLIDGTYQIEEPRIAELMRSIVRRGHSIGMHGSYNTYKDAQRLKAERLRLLSALEAAGVPQDVVENRQHYLRWDASCTPDFLHDAGFRVDTSGGFADLPGFRYGTARPFRLWSWQKQEPLALVQKPLIVMEGSLLSPLYQKMSEDDALRTIEILKFRAMSFGGDFSLLWHNSDLESPEQIRVFSSAICTPKFLKSVC